MNFGREPEPYKPYTGGSFVIQHRPTDLNDWYKDRGWHRSVETWDTLDEAIDTLRSWTGVSREWFEWRVAGRWNGKTYPDPGTGPKAEVVNAVKDDPQDEAATTPGYIIADLLASVLLSGYERLKKTDLYTWELNGCRYLLGLLDRGEYVGNDWTASFVRLNRDAILAGHVHMNFNLRAARLAAEA